jgi:hypothetical protein
MTKWIAICPECSQRWHAWAERKACPCPQCIASNTDPTGRVWRDLGIHRRVGWLQFEEQVEQSPELAVEVARVTS